MDDVPILEVYSGKRAADLGAQLNLLDRGKLTKEALSGINLALERLAHDDLRKGRRSRGGCVALTIRIGQPCSRDDNGQGRNCPSKQRASGDVLRCHRNRSTVNFWAYTLPPRCLSTPGRTGFKFEFPVITAMLISQSSFARCVCRLL